MHSNQCAIIGTFVQFIIQQSQKEYKFDINDVTEAIINNNALYITIGANRKEVIQLFS